MTEPKAVDEDLDTILEANAEDTFPEVEDLRMDPDLPKPQPGPEDEMRARAAACAARIAEVLDQFNCYQSGTLTQQWVGEGPARAIQIAPSVVVVPYPLR